MSPPPWLRTRTGSLVLVGLGALLLTAVLAGAIPGWRPDPVDAQAYWSVDPTDPYRGQPVGTDGGYYYSPVFAQLVQPLTALAFDWFVLAWRALPVIALFAVGAGPAIAFPPVVEDIVRGNVHVLLTLAVVAGFRWPAAWAAVLLTKVTPGIGLLWFAVRREWRKLGVALGATAAVVAVSALLGGVGPWLDWVATLAGSAEGLRTYTYLGIDVPPLWARMPAAAALVAWGGLTDRRWTVPLAAMLALPVLWPGGFAMLVGVVLVGRGSPDRAAGRPAAGEPAPPVLSRWLAPRRTPGELPPAPVGPTEGQTAPRG
jgi:hypothetical protein